MGPVFGQAPTWEAIMSDDVTYTFRLGSDYPHRFKMPASTFVRLLPSGLSVFYSKWHEAKNWCHENIGPEGERWLAGVRKTRQGRECDIWLTDDKEATLFRMFIG